MITLKQILVPTDFSEASAAAVTYTKALAEALGSSVHILHVLEDPFLHAPAEEGFVPPPGFYEDMEQSARSHAEQLLTDAERKQFHALIVMRKGSAFLEIIRYAKEQNIDLIVMGTHGRGPIAHMLMGSVAEKVVRKAPCAVLTVRDPEHEFVMP